MEDDAELRLLERRKLDAMRKRIKTTSAPAKAEKTDRQIVEEMLYDRGDEVLEAAFSIYPVQTERMVNELAGMIREGRLLERVSGGELYSIFRQLGLRFRLKTSIKVQDRGKLVDLSEKLSRKEE
ncbi:MAG: DNA-binding protein [Candidatus Gagatemarchaeaceae archaeon]